MTSQTNEDVRRGYASDASSLIDRYNAISSDDLYAHVIDFFPKQPSQIIDIGAGTGRDARWLAAKGHNVLAVEPVQELNARDVDYIETSRVSWLQDALPDLEKTKSIDRLFDFALMCGVWQHIEEQNHEAALQNIRKILKNSGVLLMSIRKGPGAPTRPCFPTNPDTTISQAEKAGFRVRHKSTRPSLQASNRAAGVTWTWLVLEAEKDANT